MQRPGRNQADAAAAVPNTARVHAFPVTLICTPFLLQRSYPQLRPPRFNDQIIQLQIYTHM